MTAYTDVPARGRKWTKGALLRDRTTNDLYRVTGAPERYHEDCPPRQAVAKVKNLPEKFRAAKRLLEIMEQVKTRGRHTPSSRGARQEQQSDPCPPMPNAVEWTARKEKNSYASYPRVQISGDCLFLIEPIYDDSPVEIWLTDHALADEAIHLIAASPALDDYDAVSVR